MPDWTVAFIPVIWVAVAILMWGAYSEHVQFYDGGSPPWWRARPLVVVLWPIYGSIFIIIGLVKLVTELSQN
jgi:hypothetical protein